VRLEVHKDGQLHCSDSWRHFVITGASSNKNPQHSNQGTHQEGVASFGGNLKPDTCKKLRALSESSAALLSKGS
jgi:hypothetical protein